DDNRAVINAGMHSVIEPPDLSSPEGSSGPNAGVWEPVSLIGPGLGGAPPGEVYPVWKWANSPVESPSQLGYADTRDALPQRVANWGGDPNDLQTPEGWAEKLYTN